ncbi:MAG: hypothetical protein AAFS10_23330, partial [Myxococcota bacterium]
MSTSNLVERPPFDALPLPVLQRIHLNFAMERVRWQAMRHMRRFAPRLIEASGTYSDLCVGPHEFRTLIGSAVGPQPDAWLNDHDVPKLERIEHTLTSLERDLQTFEQSLEEEQLAALPIEHIRRAFHLDEDDIQLLMVVAAPAINPAMMRLMTVTWADFAVRLPTAHYAANMVSANPEHVVELIERLSDRSPLIKMRLLIPEPHAHYPRHTPRSHAPLSMDQRLIDTLSAAPITQNIPAPYTYHDDGPPLNALFIPEGFAQTLTAALTSQLPRLLLTGSRHSGRRTLVRAISREALKQPTLEIDLHQLLTGSEPTSLPVRIAELQREARLLRATLLLRAEDELTASLPPAVLAQARRLGTLFADFPGAVVATSPKRSQLLTELLASPVEMSYPSFSHREQVTIWLSALQ